MTDTPLDKVLANVDRLHRVHDYFESIGSTSEQAATAAKAHAEKFDWNGAVLSFQGKPVADPDNGVREWFTTNKLDFLHRRRTRPTRHLTLILICSRRHGQEIRRLALTSISNSATLRRPMP